MRGSDRRPAPDGAGPSPPRPQKPSDLMTAADLVPREPEPSPAKVTPAIPVEVEVICQGRLVKLRPTLTLDQLPKFLARLDARGLHSPPLPVAHTPSGEPICPKHHSVMYPHEKQGDSWYSHKVGAAGHYCKGRPGKDSPGWDLP